MNKSIIKRTVYSWCFDSYHEFINDHWHVGGNTSL